MNQIPKISVIIPVYNVEDYLEICIYSILNQSYQNIELILVNDGSTDDCAEICDKFALKDERCTVIHQDNGGLSSARNTGLEIANGEFISFIDSDDYIHPETYTIAINCFKKYKDLDLVEWEYKKVFVNDIKNYEKNISDINIDTNLIETHNKKEFAKYLLDYSKHKHIVCNKLFKFAFIKDIKFKINLFAEDLFFTNEYMLKISKVAYIPAKLYFYFQRVGSLVNSKITRKFNDDIIGFYKRHQIYKEYFPELVELDLYTVITSIFNRLNDLISQNNSDITLIKSVLDLMIYYYYDEVLNSTLEQNIKDNFILAKKDFNGFIVKFQKDYYDKRTQA